LSNFQNYNNDLVFHLLEKVKEKLKMIEK